MFTLFCYVHSGEQIRKSLTSTATKLPGVIKEIRGWGLINGVEMTTESGVTAAEVAKLLMDTGILVVPAGMSSSIFPRLKQTHHL